MWTSRRTHIVAGLLLGGLALQLFTAIPENSPTHDEFAHHVVNGYLALTEHDFRLNPSAPPLFRYLAALPWLPLRLHLPLDHPSRRDLDSLAFARQTLYEANRVNVDWLFTLARIPIALCALLFGWLVFTWSRQLFGNAGGLLSVLAYSFCPNIIAHGSLATNDVGVAGCILLAIFILWRYVNQPSPARLVWVGITFGLAQLAKFSAAILWVLYPLLLIAPAWELLAKVPSATLARPHRGRASLGAAGSLVQRLRRWTPWPLAGSNVPQGHLARSPHVLEIFQWWVTRVIAIFAIGFVAIWAGYQFETAPLLHRVRDVGEKKELIQAAFAQAGLPTTQARQVAELAERVPIPAPSYWQGLFGVLRLMRRGFDTYLMGQTSHTGFRHYYLVTVLVKTPIPLLIAFGIVLVTWARWRAPGRWTKLYLAAIPVVFAISSSLNRLQVGIRYILPVYFFAFVCLGALATLRWRRPVAQAAALRHRSGLPSVAGVLAAWLVIGTLEIWPNHLAYFNELAGGPTQGHRYLRDSNLDWGQGLMALKRYMDEHEIPDAVLMAPWVTLPPRHGLRVRIPSPDEFSVPRPGWYAVSPNYIDSVTWASRHHPIARPGRALFLYRIE